MSFAASIVGDIDAADDKGVARLQSVKIEAVTNSERKRLAGHEGGSFTLLRNGSYTDWIVRGAAEEQRRGEEMGRVERSSVLEAGIEEE